MPRTSPLYLRVPLELVVERIYDAALDRDVLPAAIGAMARATGALGGMLGIYDVVQGGGHAPAIHGLDEALMPAFNQRFTLNPWTHLVAKLAQPGLAFGSERYLSIEDVAAQDPAFYETILQPQSIVGQSMFLVRHDGRFTVGVSMMHAERGRSHEPEVLRRLALLGRHLQRAFALMVELDTLRNRLHTTEDALDRVRCAVLVVDAAARILFANRAARGLLAEGDGLACAGSVLGAHDHSAAVALHAMVAHAAGGTGKKAAVPGLAAPRIPRGADRLPLVAIAVTAAQHRFALSDGKRSALLFVADPAARGGPAADLLREVFGFTEREASVAACTARLGNLPAAAGELNIAISTARSHLQHVFDKTGTRSQVELVQLLAALGSLPPGAD